MKIVSLFIGLLLINLVASATFTLSANKTVKNSDSFSYRAATIFTYDLAADLGTVGAFVSASVDAQGSGGTGSVNANVIVGAVRFVTSKNPVSYLGFAHGMVVAATQAGVTNFNYSATAGFILNSALRLDERDASGATIRSINFKGLQWDVTKGQDASETLYYLTVKGKNFLGIPSLVLKDGESVEFSFFISKTLGVVKFQSVEAVVTPKSLESVISITGWKYVSQDNHLVLVFGSVAGGLGVSGSGSASVISAGTGDNQVYISYSNEADIAGTKHAVVVTHKDEADFKVVVDDAEIQIAVQRAVVAGLAAKITEVAFPAGSNQIIYDPAVGSGPVPVVENSGASAIIISLLVLVFALLF
jgi:hypothetical protein